jgi:hypothetical protein
MFCIISLASTMPASKVMPAAGADPDHKKVPEAVHTIDHCHSSFEELVYGGSHL